MAEAATIAAISAVVSAATGAAATGYSMYAGEKASGLAKKQYESEQAMQAKQLASAEEMAEQDRKDYGAAMQRDQSRRRQMLTANQSGAGRYGTLLTNEGTYSGTGGGSQTVLG